MSRRTGPPLFYPSEVREMSRCSECDGDIAGPPAKVRGRNVHPGVCEERALREVAEEHRSVPDPPCFVYPDE